ncbi:MAG: hypothetical protein JNK23_12905 [Opitutaceae bacterium]|nr:hypothetical protein [Opitutaceae bacterium]
MNPKLLASNSVVATGRNRRALLPVFLGLTALVALAGCASDGYYGGPARPGPYRSGGYYIDGVHRGNSYGIQHGFGRSGFGGGRRH